MMTLVRFLRLLTRRKEIDNDLSNSQLRRCLNVFDLTSIGVGATVGAGLYVVTGQIARDVAGPAIVLSFFIAAVAAFLSGICYAEFGCRVTKAGSAYIYTYSSLGEIWAFIIGWNMILEYVIGTASLGRASSEYIDSIAGGVIRKFFIDNIGQFNATGLGTYPDFLAFALVLAVSSIVASGAKHSAVFNKIVTTVNMLVILFIFAVGLFHVNPVNWAGSHQFLPYGVSGVLAGAASCFYCFVGFDVIATASEETINPKRAIPLSIMLCLVISFLAYFGVAAILTLMVSYDKLDKFAPLPEAFKSAGVPAAKYVIAVGGLCALAGSLMSGIFAVPRIMYSMASDGLLFKVFSRIYERTNVPVISIAFAGLLSAILALLLDLKQLVEMLSIGTLLAYTLVSLSVLVLRFQPGVEDVDYDEETSSSVRSYKIICCQKTLPESKGPEYKPLGNVTGDKNKDKKDAEEPTDATSQIANAAVSLIVVSLAGFCALLIAGWGALGDGEAWAIFTASLLGLFIIFGVVVMQLQPKNNARFPFKVPCVPTLPIASVVVNLFLLLKLSPWTWVRFGVWMVLGFIIYFTYGIRNSVEGTPKQDANDNDFILQGTPDIEQDMHEVQPTQVSEDKQPLTSSLGDQQ
ncbi:cationic amino acid transporter 2-like [Montipora capricornis]|uniref:cationic amino acid transporter 2-like n=1 Tax=Montipora capricornis TaxID=246305 RepID=UPI0035F1CDBC